MGQVPMAAAHDGLFPPLFGQLSRARCARGGIVVSAVLSDALVLTQAAGHPASRRSTTSSSG